ncbi:MAG: thioredoxin family protein [Nitrososphaerota archaeon]|nr:thioredoxin family protein [Candidatus Bathyarchaeota archaeon]MDW8193587.1 thioredoxin family protein [Nitrososphaerota archaeon]
MIPEAYKKHLAEELTEKLTDQVKIVVFTQEVECPSCAQTRSLIQELASLNPKISFEVHDFMADPAKAKEYGVDKVPAVVIVGRRDYGLRFYGLPYGYEFKTLIEGLIAASKGVTDLPEDIKRELKALTSPVHIQVFVTLTCPYCPAVAATAYKFAVESNHVKADVVNVSEFPHLGLRYGVMGVPKTVINNKVEFVGAVPEDIFMEYVLLAANSP